jgi:SRSO17 transposase
LPGDEVWLVGEHRASGERKYYLSNLPADTPLEELAATIKAALAGLLPGAPVETDRSRSDRWVGEQAHQQLKEELGLDHFEGRSWTGSRRHALMTMMAFAFLRPLRLEQASGRGKSGPAAAGPPPRPTLPAVRRLLVERLWRAAASCPHGGAHLRPALPEKLPRWW